MAHIAFSKTDHRPWPVPDGPWKWRQSWCDLLFAHWPVPSSELKHLVPEPLEINEFDGTSWVGIVPFRMEGVTHRYVPDLPGLSAFPELNVRLYVEYEGRPGVWFLSLDATNPLAIWAARRFFYLPYYLANMNINYHGGKFHYHSHRITGSVGFEADYKPVSEPYEAEKGSPDHWLTERYCLYAQSPKGDLFRAEVHHQPWPLQKAEAQFQRNELLNPFNIQLSDTSPLLHFASRLDVVIWPPERIAM